MDEQNKQPEQNKAGEKKLSRTTLTFYIVGTVFCSDCADPDQLCGAVACGQSRSKKPELTN